MTGQQADTISPPLPQERLRSEAGRSRHIWRHEETAWHRLLLCVACCLAAQLGNRLLGGRNPLAVLLVAGLAAVGWLSAVRFLLLDTMVRRFWIIWLGIALAVLVALGDRSAGPYVAFGLTLLFLCLRTYQPYRRLSSVRRAKIFGLGLLSVVAVWLGWSFGEGTQLSGPAGFGRNLALYAIWSLRFFWVFSLIHLFLRMRLHFMRLKPKLAVSALFVALVPLVLFVIFSLLAVYGFLGSSRASRGRDVLNDWSALVEAGGVLGREPFAISFQGEGEERSVARGQPPPWLPEVLNLLASPPALRSQAAGAPAAGVAVSKAPAATAPPVAGPDTTTGAASAIERTSRSPAESRIWTPVDTTAYFQVGSQLWLLRLRGLPDRRPRADGYLVDGATLDHLSRLLRADAGLIGGESSGASEDADSEQWAVLADKRLARIRVQGHQQPQEVAGADSLAGFWQRPLAFGGAYLDVLQMTPGGAERGQIALYLQVKPVALVREVFGGGNEINRGVIIVLAVIAFLFLLVEAVALVLGVRITTGITSAVQALHRGTRRLAAGDWSTQIAIPNEDEFGDLAASFNEMTVAVAHGQREAIARERLERELATAREIQQRLLPHESPLVPGFELAGVSVPSRQVGGDYFDFLDQGQERLGLAIGDVSGKGMPAALLMATLQASLKGQVIHPSSVAEVVGRVNDLLVQSTDPHMFVTFFYGVLDRTGGRFTFTNAGHNPPILRHADGTIEHLAAGGLLLGMLARQPYQQQEVVMAPGDVLVLYTDGITEAVGPPQPAAGAGEVPPAASGSRQDDEVEEADQPLFGEEALLEVIHAAAGRSAAEIKEAILAAVARYAAGTPQSDDITLVVVKRQTV